MELFGYDITGFLILIIAINTGWCAFYLQRIRELIGEEIFLQRREKEKSEN